MCDFVDKWNFYWVVSVLLFQAWWTVVTFTWGMGRWPGRRPTVRRVSNPILGIDIGVAVPGLQQQGASLWEEVGCYNSETPKPRWGQRLCFSGFLQLCRHEGLVMNVLMKSALNYSRRKIKNNNLKFYFLHRTVGEKKILFVIFKSYYAPSAVSNHLTSSVVVKHVLFDQIFTQ